MTPATYIALGLAAVFALGQLSTRSIETEITVNAPPETVWNILTDGNEIASWNPFVTQLEGPMKIGETLTVTIQPPNNKAMQFSPKVLVADAGQELRWRGRLGVRGLFDGEHYFVLHDHGNGTTTLQHGENFRGLLTYALFALIGTDTTEGFHQMNTALKARAEA